MLKILRCIFLRCSLKDIFFINLFFMLFQQGNLLQYIFILQWNRRNDLFLLHILLLKDCYVQKCEFLYLILSFKWKLLAKTVSFYEYSKKKLVLMSFIMSKKSMLYSLTRKQRNWEFYMNHSTHANISFKYFKNNLKLFFSQMIEHMFTLLSDLILDYASRSTLQAN